MSLNEEACLDTEPLDAILSSVPQTDSCYLVPILQQIQKVYGYLPAQVLHEFCTRSGIAASQVYGVVTFYEQFHLTPQGRHTIKCCRGTACHVKGGSWIINAIERTLGVGSGETTEDMKFTFETVACLGTCFLAPVIMVDNDYYGNLERHQIEDILKKYE